jgi:hypothetical protein
MCHSRWFVVKRSIPVGRFAIISVFTLRERCRRVGFSQASAH